MDDIRQWHVMFAILVAATIHTVAVTLYLAFVRPAASPILPPPLIFLRSPPPPAVTLPPEIATPPDADIPPIAAPAYDPDLPSVTLRRAEEPPPPEPVVEKKPPEPLDLTQFEVLPPRKPEPLDLTQFEVLPPDKPVPVPKAKLAPPQIAAAPVPQPAPLARREALAAKTPNLSAAKGAPLPSGIRWPEKVEDLTPAQKHQLLTEYYVDDKSNWEPWHRNRDDAWRRLDLGFVDPTAPPDFVDLEERLDLRPPNWDPHEGPRTGQELEETLRKLVAAGTRRMLGVDVASVNALTYAQRQKLLRTHYKDDPRWAIGIVDPTAPPDFIDLEERQDLRPLNWDPHEGPLTVQDLNAALEKLVQLGTQQFIGRTVRSAKELSYGERQIILEKYYGKDPRWQIGIIDPTVPPDLLDLGERQDVSGGGYIEEESPLTVQEVEETLKKMLTRKLEEQGSAPRTDPPPATPAQQ
jgi:hypothetical protein